MFPPEVLLAFQQDAVARYPEEACGLITPDGYVPLPNVAADPREDFDMGEAGLKMLQSGVVLAAVHSHPDGPDEPSVADQQQQIATDIPWGLCSVYDGVAGPVWFWGEGKIPPPPLMPRDFRWGPSGTDGRGDCLALIRDWYRLEKGLTFPEVARDVNWMENDPRLYVDGLQKCGFRPVSIHEPKHGDVVLIALQSAGVPNHAGIYLEGGFLLHHMQNRMALRESFVFWRPGAVLLLRYQPMSEA